MITAYRIGCRRLFLRESSYSDDSRNTIGELELLQENLTMTGDDWVLVVYA